MCLIFRLITAAAVIDNAAGARNAASPQGGGGESNTQPKLVKNDKVFEFFRDMPLVATIVRASPHDAGAIVTNARVAHARATTVQGQALQQESKCENMVKRKK